MATTLDSYMPYDSGPGANVTEDGWRRFMKHLRGDGVIRNYGNEFAVHADSTGMQVKVKTGECWIQGNWGQSLAERVLPIASNSSGNPRQDRVILRNDFGANRIELDVLTGTPAAAPVAPNVTQNTSKWEISLGLVTVASGAVTIAAGNVTDWRVFVDGACRYTVDSGLQTIANTTITRVDFDLPEFQTSAVERPSIREFRLMRSGMWMVELNVFWDANATGWREAYVMKQGGTSRFAYVTTPATSGSLAQNVVGITRFNANDIIEAYVWQNSGANRQLLDSAGATAIAFYWLGP